MSGNSFGYLFKFVTFGESHGPAIGCVIDGAPPNINLTEEDSIQLGNNDASTSLPNPDLLNDFPVWSFEGEARYKLCVTMRF